MRISTYVYDYYFYNRKYSDTENSNIRGVKELSSYDNLTDIKDTENDSDYESDRESGKTNQFAQKTRRDYSRRFVALLFTKMENGKTMSISILNYHPFFYIGIPEDIINKQSFARELIGFIKESISVKHRNDSLLESINIVDKRLYGGFTNGKLFPFIQIRFKNSNTRQAYGYAVKKLRYKNGKIYKSPDFVKEYEHRFVLAGFTDSHRYTMFIESNNKLLSSGYIKLDSSKIINISPQTVCDFNVAINYKDLIESCEVDPEEHNYPPKFKSISWDIETYPLTTRISEQRMIRTKFIAEKRIEIESEYKKILSDTEYQEIIIDRFKNTKEYNYVTELNERYRKDLKMHASLDNNDIIFSIALSILESVYNNTNEGIMRNIVLILNKSSKELLAIYNKENPNSNLTIIECNSEVELITKMITIIRKESPEFLYSYNGDGFDFKWIQSRCKHYGIYENTLSHMSKMYSSKFNWVTRTSETTQRGVSKFSYPYMPGIVNIDLYYFFKNMNNSAHTELTLKWISKFYLPKENQKKDLSYYDMYEHIRISYRNPDTDVAKEGIFTVALYNIYDCISLHHLVHTCAIMETFLVGCREQKMSIHDTIRSGNSIGVHVGQSYYSHKYNMIIPHDTFSIEKTVDYILKTNETSKLMYEELGLSKMKTENYNLWKKNVMKKIFVGGSAKGGYCQCIESGRHENIICLDVAGQYPAMIIAFNLCPSTLVLDIEKYGNIQGLEYIDLEWTTKNKNVQIARYVKPDPNNINTIGILPMALKDALARRAHYKDLLKKRANYLLSTGVYKEYDEILVKDGLAKSYNITQGEVKKFCNSHYGTLLCMYTAGRICNSKRKRLYYNDRKYNRKM